MQDRGLEYSDEVSFMFVWHQLLGQENIAMIAKRSEVGLKRRYNVFYNENVSLYLLTGKHASCTYHQKQKLYREVFSTLDSLDKNQRLLC